MPLKSKVPKAKDSSKHTNLVYVVVFCLLGCLLFVFVIYKTANPQYSDATYLKMSNIDRNGGILPTVEKTGSPAIESPSTSFRSYRHIANLIPASGEQTGYMENFLVLDTAKKTFALSVTNWCGGEGIDVIGTYSMKNNIYTMKVTDGLSFPGIAGKKITFKSNTDEFKNFKYTGDNLVECTFNNVKSASVKNGDFYENFNGAPRQVVQMEDELDPTALKIPAD